LEAFNIRHSGLDPESRISVWIPAFAGMTTQIYANIYATFRFTIAKRERFLKKLEEPKTMDQRIHYSGTMHDLGYLYKRKKDCKRALEIFSDERSIAQVEMLFCRHHSSKANILSISRV
jgi:hypothetical protein